MGVPPFVSGAYHEADNAPFPAVTLGHRGAPGTVTGVPVVEAAGPAPHAFVACTLTVY
jgi:hypothetical protein